MSFYNNYVAMCNNIGKSPSAVATEIGIQKSTVSRWSKGSTPNHATAMKVASYFDVPVYMLTGEATPKDMVQLLLQAEEDKEKRPPEMVSVVDASHPYKGPAIDVKLSGSAGDFLDELLELAKSVPDDKAELVLRVLRSIVSDEK